MDSKLILFNRELNPDVHFERPELWSLFLGVDWSVFANSQKGARKVSGGVSSLINNQTDLIKPLTTYKYTLAVVSSLAGTLDLVLGNTTVSIPNTAVPVIYTGTITSGTGSGLLILTGSALNVTTISYLNIVESPESYEIDLTEDINVPLNYAIADIKDMAGRDTAYSKTITIPFTKNTAKYFKALFEIERDSDFKPGKKRRALVITEGEETFNGVMQLMKINRINNGLNNYDLVNGEIKLIGNLAGFYYNLGELLLTDLDFSEYDHEYNITNQRNSWYTQVIKNGVPYSNFQDGAIKTITNAEYTATGVKFTFSAAHGFVANDNIFISAIGNNLTEYLGDHKVRSVPSNTTVILYFPFLMYSSTATSYAVTGSAYYHQPTGEGYYYGMANYGQSLGYNWCVGQLYAQLYFRTIVYKIAERAGYQLDSNFLDSYDFKRIVLSYGGQGRLSDEEIVDRTFRAEGVGSFVSAPEDGVAYTVPFDDDFTSPNFDGGGTFNAGTGEWTVVENGIFNLTTILNLNKTAVGGVDTGQCVIQIYNSTTATVLAQTLFNRILIPTSYSASAVFPLSVNGITLTQGDVIEVRLTNPITGSADRTIFSDLGSCFFAECANTMYQEGSTIEMNKTLPRNIKCSDFFRAVLQAFRLVVQSDLYNDKKLTIEPEVDFFGSGQEIDITSMLDTSQKLEIIPMGELTNKFYNFNYKEDKDILSEDHLKVYGKVYGNKRLSVDNDFLKSEYSTDLLFASTVIHEYPEGSGRILSCMTNSIIDPNKPILQGSLRMLYTKVSSTSFPNTWNHKSVSGTITAQIYPYCGHLDKAFTRSKETTPIGPCPSTDLNFDYPVATYFNYNAWTDNNLFNRFHKKELDQIFDKDSNVITGWFYFKASFIRKLDFRNIFILDGHALRLNKISDWFANKNLPVFAEFLLLTSKPPFVPTFTSSSNVGNNDTENSANQSMLPGLRYENNSSNQSGQFNDTISIQGQENIVSNIGTFNITVNGNSNTINQNSSNINVSGDNNFISGGLSNVTLINTNNQTVTESNITYINGLPIRQIARTGVSSPGSYEVGQYGVEIADASGGNINYQMPDPALYENVRFLFKLTGLGVGANVFLNDFNGELFDNSAGPYMFTVAYEKAEFMSDGTNWLKLR